MMQNMPPRRARPGMNPRFIPTADMPIPGGRLITVLGVAYVHTKTKEGGDLYLTRFGLQVHDVLQVENWYEPEWFTQHRCQLQGTSTVFRVPTREVGGRSLELVVKNCRVGEDVPMDTHTIEQAMGAEFNSPWEEFAVVMELREGAFGPQDYSVTTQRPLAIYVPPDFMQLWQSGRSRAKINRIKARHPGIDLDILRQYKLVYEWIFGQNVVELLKSERVLGGSCETASLKANDMVTAELADKGFLVADMKPQHIIISDSDSAALLDDTQAMSDLSVEQRLLRLIEQHRYSIIDYELLARTAEHEQKMRVDRRHTYLDALSHRHEVTPLPQNLHGIRVLDMDYIHGTVQSTGGELWVVGRNPNLFDFFLPERWRKTALWRLADDTELSYTITKDGVHVFWTTSRVGETAPPRPDGARSWYQSPFEVFSTMHALAEANVPVIAPRAIYRTHTSKLEASEDHRAFELMSDCRFPDGELVLRDDRNYVMIFGFYCWVRDGDVPMHMPPVPRPAGLLKAEERGLITSLAVKRSVESMKQRIAEAGFDGSSVSPDDLLVTLDHNDAVVLDDSGEPAVRLHDGELITRR